MQQHAAIGTARNELIGHTQGYERSKGCLLLSERFRCLQPPLFYTINTPHTPDGQAPHPRIPHSCTHPPVSYHAPSPLPLALPPLADPLAPTAAAAASALRCPHANAAALQAQLVLPLHPWSPCPPPHVAAVAAAVAAAPPPATAACR
eukprot:1162016-Pelagomonas_calceolata.AAC.17